MKKSAQHEELFQLLDSDDLEQRVDAITILGETGDERTLKTLRERLAPIGKEHYALIVAAGKLEKSLKAK